MKKYTARGAYYDVKGKTGRVARPTKNAAGMTYTRQRSRHGGALEEYSDPLRLAVRGTLAKTPSLGFYMESVNTMCPCCHQMLKKFRINDVGKRRLHHFRLARARSRTGRPSMPRVWMTCPTARLLPS